MINMSNKNMKYYLCRLCLAPINSESYQLLHNMLSKLHTCLPFSLTMNEELPDKLCMKCVNKIEEMYEFCMTTKDNEQILQNHLENGTLVDYYSLMTKDIPINRDITTYTINKSVNELFIDKKSDGIPNEVTTKNNDCDNEIPIVKVENEINDEFDDNINNSTDDEDNIALSSIKNNEDSSNTVNNINNTRIVRDRTITLKDSKNIVLENSCLTCDKICKSHSELKEHYRQEHTIKKGKAIEVTYTETIVNGTVMYKCDCCGKTYAKKNLKRHLLHHTGVRPYVCKLCSRSYITISDIMRHGSRAHSGIKMLCAFNCGFSTAYSGALKTHEDRMHKNENKYTCGTCGKGFQAKTWYDQHQNVHTGVKPYVCNICGHSFHMEKNLTSHHSNMHPDKRRLICVHCNLKCESEKALESHLLSEHVVVRKRPNRRKKALCDLCGKILNRPEDLVLHRRMHLGQKPYKCSICNKRFPRKFTMQVHERSHSRNNAHECERCGKRYSQQSALYRHQRQQHALPLKRQKTVENS